MIHSEARAVFGTEPRPAAPQVHWQIVTGEYPPQTGGVSDYTRLVARALALAGHRVDVWAPPCAAGSSEGDAEVSVHRLPDHFGPRSLRVLDRQLDALPGPRRLLVQYVPHAFGWKALNLPFCWWLRSRREDLVWIMFHEVAYPVGSEYSARENALGAVTRWMAAIVSRSAERIFVSIPAWQPILESLIDRQVPIEWLPVPSTISPIEDLAGVAHLRSRIAGDCPLVGHLGTYGRLIEPMLSSVLPGLLAATNCRILLLGRQGDSSRDSLTTAHPRWADRVVAPGQLSDTDLSRHVSACDVMVQPYPDGVTSRRTSIMAALSHGRPVVTTMGWLSEPFWSGCGAVVTVPVEQPGALIVATSQLLSDPARMADLSASGRRLYAERFDLAHTIERLQFAGLPRN